MKAIVPWIGGKVRLSSWIIDYLGNHEVYVEPFGGGAGVLLNKEESKVEVYNDIDENVVQFFQTLRNRGAALQEWLSNVPYSRKLYREWKADYLEGDYPDDPVVRAGRYFLVCTASMQADKTKMNGFKASRSTNRAKTFFNKVESMKWFVERMRKVVIENRDFEDIVSKYDGSDTLFYLDPPYVGVGDAYYRHEGLFPHDRLASVLRSLDGAFALSYGSDVPDEILRACEEQGWVKHRRMNKQDTNRNDVKEHLITNY